MTRAGRQPDYINLLFLLRNEIPPQTSTLTKIQIKPVATLIILYRKSIKVHYFKTEKGKSATKLQIISGTTKQETWSRHYIRQNVASQILFSSLCGQTNSFVMSPELLFWLQINMCFRCCRADYMEEISRARFFVYFSLSQIPIN